MVCSARSIHPLCYLVAPYVAYASHSEQCRLNLSNRALVVYSRRPSVVSQHDICVADVQIALGPTLSDEHKNIVLKLNVVCGATHGRLCSLVHAQSNRKNMTRFLPVYTLCEKTQRSDLIRKCVTVKAVIDIGQSESSWSYSSANDKMAIQLRKQRTHHSQHLV